MAIPRLATPFTIGPNGVATVEQDTPDDVAACVYAITATELDSRIELMDFGVIDPTFRQGGADLEELHDAATEWEPRARTVLTQDVADNVNALHAQARVGVG
jgi:hypothetical protein